MTDIRRLLAPWRARRSLPVHASRAAGQSRKTFAIARNRGPSLAESALTTSSSRHLHVRASSRSGRKSENTNKAGRIFLVVAIAHRERTQIGAIKRVVGMPAYNRYIALIQREHDRSCYSSLGSFNESIKRFPQWSEPHAVIHELRILQANMLLE